MAIGVRSLLSGSGTDIGKVVTIATTGMASDDPDKPGGPPAGLVYVAVQLPSRPAEVLKLSLLGSRNEIRQEAAGRAALLLQSLLNRD
jgi:nicotinamide mononucleotide (NMN) deamidase PncC